MGLVSCLCSYFKSSLLSLCTHCVNPLRWLQSSNPSIPRRQVVCFIQIKTIIFHACTHTASASYTFTCYYLSELSWLQNTPLQIKRRWMCQKPDIIKLRSFSRVVGRPVFSLVCDRVKIRLHAEAPARGKPLHRWDEVSSLTPLPTSQTIKALCWGDEMQLCNLSGSNDQE